jgi:hypothetical protein
MPIQIQTNFQTSEQTPIDSRLVVDTITQRDNIEYKFVGLKVYVKSQKITYEWTPSSTWKQDDNFRTKGIYGGTGSIPDDIDISYGSVDTTLNSKSKQIYKFSNTAFGTSTGRPSNQIRDFFKRRSVGEDYDTVSYVNQYYFRDQNETTLLPTIGLEDSSIEFNGEDHLNQQILGSLVFNLRNNSKFIISPKNYFAFYSGTDATTQLPITIAEFDSQKYLGYNFDPSRTDRNYTFDNSKNAYRIKFGDNNVNELTLETKLANKPNFIIPFKIKNVDSLTTNLLSPVEFLIDKSTRNWSNSGELQSIDHLGLTNIIRDTESRFTKIQLLNFGTQNSFTDGILYLNPNGNSFNINLAGGTLKDIKINKGGQISDYPNGTILYFKMISGGNISLISKTDPLKRDSKIYSDLDDVLTILNDDSIIRVTFRNVNSAMPITIRRNNNFWEIINIDRLRRFTFRIYRKSNVPQVTNPDWILVSPAYLDKFTTTGRYIPITSANSLYSTSQIYSNHLPATFTSSSSLYSYNSPNTFTYSETAIGNKIEKADSQSIDTTWELHISISLNRVAHIQGNFKIELKNIITNPRLTTQNFYWTSNGNSNIYNLNKDGNGLSKERENIYRVGKINNPSIIPLYDTTWFKCSGYSVLKANPVRRINFVNPILSISKKGEMFLSFGAQPSWTVNTISDLDFTSDVDVFIWVPSSSYLVGSYDTVPT